MDDREITRELSQEGSELYKEIELYLSANIHPGHKEPLTIERLVCGEGNFPISHFVDIFFRKNQVYHNTVETKWYNELKKIGLKYSVFLNLPVKHLSSV
jgi:hypothetical protein